MDCAIFAYYYFQNSSSSVKMLVIMARQQCSSIAVGDSYSGRCCVKFAPNIRLHFGQKSVLFCSITLVPCSKQDACFGIITARNEAFEKLSGLCILIYA
jgi:hypothetical protein